MAGVKTAGRKTTMPGVSIDPGLSKYKDMPLFSEKLVEANRVLAQTGLPGEIKRNLPKAKVSQILHLSERINRLTEQLRLQNKNLRSHRELMRMTGQRKRLLIYLQKTNPGLHSQILQRIGLRSAPKINVKTK